ncbi:CaiB/BaiF CoA transferase family protein [Pleionea sediminis]|uniref:CaiB/BaiF CoA transferase family protein n=1 Tax=Pleionea sediminis TaxID=2569479 RepID=UPI0011870844|nr:CaiB/BaiF CoA-transferase family protein [Pleionea sediminis]
MSGPLAGIKVLDLSRILAGPWATQVLADYGAEVIKIERPNAGDDTRHWGPPYHITRSKEELSAYFLSTNRGKQSVAVDISTPEGQAIIKKLSRECDVFIENFKVGGLEPYGLDYNSIKGVNPHIIYCSITGFGQDGPYAQKAGYDAIIQAMGGLMSITGEPDDQLGAGPQKVGVAVSDLMTGMYAVSAILAALYYRVHGGEGQYIDLALMDTQVAWLANQGMNFLVSGESPGRQGTAHPNIVPYQTIEASDGYFMLAVGNDRQFEHFCQVIGRSELIQDDRFRTNRNRVNNRELLISIIQSVTQQKPRAYWLKQLDDVKVPCGPINSIKEVFNDPQVKFRSMLQSIKLSMNETINCVGNPVKFSKTPIEYRKAPPVLAEDTIQVLKGAGYSESTIQDLIKLGVINGYGSENGD